MRTLRGFYPRQTAPRLMLSSCRFLNLNQLITRMFRLLQLLFVLNMAVGLHAQVTIVRTFPTDTVDLSRPGCTTEIRAVALTKGQQSIPINLDKPVKTNLLHWEYFDDISKENVVMEEKPVWTEGKQLLDLLPPEEIVSYHINLAMTDSVTGSVTRIFLVLTGLNRQQLATLPLEVSYDPDTYAIYRFSAILQRINPENGQKETFECTEGTCIFDRLDPKSGILDGYYYFTGSRVGFEHKTIFLNGRVLKR